MLRFVKLVVDNFGPFKGIQTIDFTDRDGVTIIWGNNGRGKTTLLNIFRYVLFGKIQTRQGRIEDLSMLENIEGRREGKHGFKVVLHMEMDGDKYELTRQINIREGVSVPVSNDDYVQTVYLKKNTSILSKELREHFLRNVMPEQVARFFLFDGELLQEYEELLRDELNAGASIKNAIEKILGVPVLTNGAVDVNDALEYYRSEKNKAAQKSTETESINSRIVALQSKIKSHVEEYERLKSALSIEYAAREDIQIQMSQTEHLRSLLDDARNLEAQIDEKKAAQGAVLESIAVTTKDAWKTMVIPCVQNVIAMVEKRVAALEAKGREHAQATHILSEMQAAIASHHCPVCDQDIADRILATLQEKVAKTTSGLNGLTALEQNELDSLKLRLTSLKQLRFTSIKAVLEVHEKNLRELTVQISSCERQLKDIRDEIEKYGDAESEASQLVQKHSDINTRISNLEEGKRQEQDIIDEARRQLAALEAKIDRIAVGAKFTAAKKRVDLLEQVYKVFDEGVAAYRDKLRLDVQSDATDLFLRIRNDEDYVQLEINDNYGLSIVHRSGEKVPFRSAGYEHIVALALIGALHRNAPLSGPIIMDSPFGRLDPEHKKKIASALPSMSQQVILLAYTSEIDEQDAREGLASALNGEYRLVRYTSFNTQIEKQNS